MFRFILYIYIKLIQYMGWRLILLSVASILISAGCKDDPSAFRVKTIYNINKVWHNGLEQTSNLTIDTFYYTSDGRRDYSARGITIKEVSDGRINIKTAYNRAGEVLHITTYYLNEKGLEDSIESKDATHVINSQKYFYDNDGYVIEERQYSPGASTTIWKYKVIDGNRVEEFAFHEPMFDTIQVRDPQTGEMIKGRTEYYGQVTHSDYFPDKPHFPMAKNFGYNHRDIQSKNLQRSSVQLSLSGDTQDVYFFRYTFDGKGRVSTATKVSRNGDSYDSTAYTYY